MALSQYFLVLLALTSMCLVGTQAASSHPNRHDAHNRRQDTPSQFILSSQIYERYNRTSSNYRQNSFPAITNLNGNGTWYWEQGYQSTSGFYPALLYLLNERANLCPRSTSTDWLSRARQWTAGLAPFTSYPSQGYNLGFLSYSFVEELKINPSDQTAQEGIRKWGKMLADEFSRTVKCTRSWYDDGPRDGPAFVVAIEDMMSLQLFFDAGDLDGIRDYYDYANSHANITSINHLRQDSSSYEVVRYNKTNGDIIDKTPFEGFEDLSTRSRNQAWGLYGFAMMYTRTRNDHFLEVSRAMGQLFLQRLSEDPSGVPKMNFDGPDPSDKDTFAAGIASAGFLELYQAELSKGNSTGADFWKHSAITLLSKTADAYFKSDESWDALLSDGTLNSIFGDMGLIEGDYYFVKAGNMLLQNGLIECPSR